jgi:hypothetical protein
MDTVEEIPFERYNVMLPEVFPQKIVRVSNLYIYWINRDLNRFIDHLQVVPKNNYNTIAIFTLYSSLEHTV